MGTDSGIAICTDDGQTILLSGQGIYDSVSWARSKTENLTDTLNTADSPNRQLVYYRNLSDTLITSDSISRIANYIRNPIDTTVESDLINSTSIHFVNLMNTLVTSDSLNRNIVSYRLNQETILTYDILNRLYIANRSIEDTTSISDIINRLTFLNRTNQDVFITSDSTIRYIQKPRFISDTLSFSDLLISSSTINRNLTNTFGMVDVLEWRRPITLNVNLMDTLQTSDNTSNLTSAQYLLSNYSIVGNIELSSHVIFVYGNEICQGRVVAISRDQNNLEIATIAVFKVGQSTSYLDINAPFPTLPNQHFGVRNSQFLQIPIYNLRLLPYSYR